jgi:hypothetical protein
MGRLDDDPTRLPHRTPRPSSAPPLLDFCTHTFTSVLLHSLAYALLLSCAYPLHPFTLIFPRSYAHPLSHSDVYPFALSCSRPLPTTLRARPTARWPVRRYIVVAPPNSPASQGSAPQAIPTLPPAPATEQFESRNDRFLRGRSPPTPPQSVHACDFLGYSHAEWLRRGGLRQFSHTAPECWERGCASSNTIDRRQSPQFPLGRPAATFPQTAIGVPDAVTTGVALRASLLKPSATAPRGGTAFELPEAGRILSEPRAERELAGESGDVEMLERVRTAKMRRLSGGPRPISRGADSRPTTWFLGCRFAPSRCPQGGKHSPQAAPGRGREGEPKTVREKESRGIAKQSVIKETCVISRDY